MDREQRLDSVRRERRRRYEGAVKAKAYLTEFLQPRRESALRGLLDAEPELGALLSARERLRAVLDLEAAYLADLDAGREDAAALENE